jgi:hypothetical protein
MWSKSVLGALGVAASLGIGGTAYAAGNSSPGHGSAATTQSATAAGARQAKGLYARADHISLEVRVKGQWVTYDVDRGKVTAVSPTSITLARPDGQSVTEAIDSNTKYKGAASEADIHTGRPALVVSEHGTAVRIRQSTGAGAGSAGAGTAAATLGGSVA